jgi:hypothetical protein
MRTSGIALFGAFLACSVVLSACSENPTTTEELARAIAQYTRTSSSEADDLARAFSGSDDSLRALTRTVADEPTLPVATSISQGLDDLGRSEGFDGTAAFREFCTAVSSALSPSMDIDVDEFGELTVEFSDADPASNLGPELAAAATRVLTAAYGASGFGQELLDQLTDYFWEHATENVAPSDTASDPQNALLWLRLQQIQATACA